MERGLGCLPETTAGLEDPHLTPVELQVMGSLTQSIANSSTTGTITQLVKCAQQGDDSAVGRLQHLYAAPMAKLAAYRFPPSCQRVVGVEDIVQEALASFVALLRSGKFGEQIRRKRLLSCLLRLVSYKASWYRRYLNADKRGGGRVRGDSAWECGEDSSAGSKGPGVSAHPDEQLNLKELLELLPDERLQQIARLRGEGYSVAEIAQQIDVCIRSVERKLARIRQIWARLQQD